MIERFVIDLVICNKCKKGFSGNANILVATKAELKVMAEIMHKEITEKEKILCFAPKLVIKYSNVLDCTGITESALEQVSVKKKGN